MREVCSLVSLYLKKKKKKKRGYNKKLNPPKNITAYIPFQFNSGLKDTVK